MIYLYNKISGFYFTPAVPLFLQSLHRAADSSRVVVAIYNITIHVCTRAAIGVNSANSVAGLHKSC